MPASTKISEMLRSELIDALASRFPQLTPTDADLVVKEIIDTMLKQFDKSWTDEMQAKADEMGMSVKEIVTAARSLESWQLRSALP